WAAAIFQNLRQPHQLFRVPHSRVDLQATRGKHELIANVDILRAFFREIRAGRYERVPADAIRHVEPPLDDFFVAVFRAVGTPPTVNGPDSIQRLSIRALARRGLSRR